MFKRRKGERSKSCKNSLRIWKKGKVEEEFQQQISFRISHSVDGNNRI